MDPGSRRPSSLISFCLLLSTLCTARDMASRFLSPDLAASAPWKGPTALSLWPKLSGGGTHQPSLAQTPTAAPDDAGHGAGAQENTAATHQETCAWGRGHAGRRGAVSRQVVSGAPFELHICSRHVHP